MILPAFPNNFGFAKSPVPLSSKPHCLPWECAVACHGLYPPWYRLQEGDGPRKGLESQAGILSCGGDKHTSKDVKNPACSKSFCFLPRMWKVVLVFCEVVCSLSWYEVKAVSIILLSAQNELSPPKVFHGSLTTLLSIWGTQPGVGTVPQRLNQLLSVEESHSKMKDVSQCRVRWWKNKKSDKYIHKCRKGTSSPTSHSTQGLLLQNAFHTHCFQNHFTVNEKLCISHWLVCHKTSWQKQRKKLHSGDDTAISCVVGNSRWSRAGGRADQLGLI